MNYTFDEFLGPVDELKIRRVPSDGGYRRWRLIQKPIIWLQKRKHLWQMGFIDLSIEEDK